jgi:hypothetical protein
MYIAIYHSKFFSPPLFVSWDFRNVCISPYCSSPRGHTQLVFTVQLSDTYSCLNQDNPTEDVVFYIFHCHVNKVLLLKRRNVPSIR